MWNVNLGRLFVTFSILLIADTIPAFLPHATGGDSLFTQSAQAIIRGGYGGGARVAARTTVRTGYGSVTRSVTAGSRYHVPAVRPAVRPVPPAVNPGVYPGSAVRTARRVARRTASRTAYRTASGLTYYYGPAAYVLPPACISTYWEGMFAYNCGGAIYISENSSGTVVYYPIEGI